MIGWLKASRIKKISIGVFILFGLMLSVQSTVWAETATATDGQEVQEAVVLGKIVPNAHVPNVVWPRI